MLISLFETLFDHFHFYATSGLVPDLILAVCLNRVKPKDVSASKNYFVLPASLHGGRFSKELNSVLEPSIIVQGLHSTCRETIFLMFNNLFKKF